MRIPPHSYAKVFWELTRGGSPEETEKITRKFISLVSKNGDLPSKKKILESVERCARDASGKRLLTVETARAMPDDFYADMVRKIGGGRYDVRRVVSENLVAGAKLSIDESRELDLSFATVLRNLFDKKQN